MPIALILVGEVDNREVALKVIFRRYLRVEPRGFHDELNVGFEKETKDYLRITLRSHRMPTNVIKKRRDHQKKHKG